MIRSSYPNGSVDFISSTRGERFRFPVQGSSNLVAWYFQPANEPTRYDRVRAKSLNKNQNLEVYDSGISQTELLKWSDSLLRISKLLEQVIELDGENKLAAIKSIISHISRLPEDLKDQLETDLLIGRLLLNTGLAKEALEETANIESCVEQVEPVSEYCFELLQTRVSAFERLGQFKEARDSQRSLLKAYSTQAKSDFEISQLVILQANAHLNNIHVNVADSNKLEIESSINALQALAEKEESRSILSTRQKGIIQKTLGAAIMRSGDFDGAIDPLNQAVRLLNESNETKYLSVVYSMLHSAHYIRGRYLQALDMITLALEQTDEKSPSYNDYLLVQGNALAKLGRFHQAKASLITAKAFYESSNNPYYLSACHRSLAVVESELGNYEAAKKYHALALNFFMGQNPENPNELYAFLITKSESLITSITHDDLDLSREIALELKGLYIKYFESKGSNKSLPEKSIAYALARYAASINNLPDLINYRDKLTWLLSQTEDDSYLLEKAQLEQLNLFAALQKNNLNTAVDYFRKLMTHVYKTRDAVRVVSFHRGYSNLVKGFSEPLIEELALSLDANWHDETANLLLEVLNKTQGNTIVQASREAKYRLSLGSDSLGRKGRKASLNQEVKIFEAKNEAENYALRAKADFSVLRESVIEAKQNQIALANVDENLISVDSLLKALKESEIYLNSFDTKAHSFVFYISKYSKGIVAVKKTEKLDTLIQTAKTLLVDNASKPAPTLDIFSDTFSVENIFSAGDFKHAITIGDGKLLDIPFSTLRANGQYLGAQVSNTHLVSTSYYFSEAEHFDQKLSLSNDISVIADPVFDFNNLISLNRGIENKDFQNWISSLSRLPWTSRESQYIKAVFPDAKITIKSKEQATRKNLEHLASRSDILHIATHGYFSSRTPELAGIAFTKTTDSTSSFLSLNQLSKLDIASRLIIFSACETALSEETSGDGGWGLAQAALYAGAKNAIGTLWKVPDRQTALFFEQFYGSLSGNQKDISRSLHAAKRAMIHSQYSHPYYWAGFRVFATKKIDTQPFKF